MHKIAKEANPDPEAMNVLLFADGQSMFHENEVQLQAHTTSSNAVCHVCENYAWKSA